MDAFFGLTDTECQAASQAISRGDTAAPATRRKKSWINYAAKTNKDDCKA